MQKYSLGERKQEKFEFVAYLACVICKLCCQNSCSESSMTCAASFQVKQVMYMGGKYCKSQRMWVECRIMRN